ncbi:MAG: VWA domain-containing protein, partial [Hyphomicrobium sp.]
TLSPNWNSLWATDNQAKPYPDPAAKDGVQKVAILMTDGEYNTQYNSDGVLANYGSTSYCPDAANGCSTTQALALCAAMKQKGIEVYSIGFGDGITSLAAQTLKQCSTKPDEGTHYYNADDGDALSEAFADIAIKLTTVYLSK